MSVREIIFSRQWKDYFVTAGSRLFVVVFSFTANVTIARTIGAEGRGLYALINNSILLGSIIACVGAAEAVAYFVAKDEDGRRQTLGNGLVVGCVSAAALVLAGVLLRARLQHLLGGISPTAISLVLVCILPAVMARVFRASLQGLKDFVSYNVCVLGRPLSILAYSLLLLLGLRGGLSAVPFLMLLVTISEFLINSSLALRHLRPRLGISRDRIAGIVSYGSRANVTVILQFAYLRIGIFLLGYLLTKRAVGIYSIASSLSEFQMYVPLAIGWVWMPRVVTQPLPDSVVGTRALMRKVLPVLLAISGFLTVAGQKFIPAVFGSEFAASYVPLLIMLPGSILMGMVLIMSGFFDGIGKPHLSALVSLCAAAVIVVTDLLLIPVWGVRGAAFGSSLGYLSAFLLTLAVFTSESHRLRSRNVD